MRTEIQSPTLLLTACLLSFATLVPAEALTPVETTSVLYMKQEEKMARDVYQALAARWEHVTFRNIAVSEQRHMDAIDRLITQYGLTDSTPAEPGRFSIPELQQLHDDLVARGAASQEEALRVGVLIEETDIADLKEALGVVTEPMLQRVFGNLLRGSGHHLQAFQVALGTADGTAGALTCGTKCGAGGDCVAPNGNGGQGNAQGKGKGKGKGNGNGKGNGARGGQGMCLQEGSCPTGQNRGDCTTMANPNPQSTPAPTRRGQR
jgi:hypothetical protein